VALASGSYAADRSHCGSIGDQVCAFGPNRLARLNGFDNAIELIGERWTSGESFVGLVSIQSQDQFCAILRGQRIIDVYSTFGANKG
jgi:hypothetical protein